MRKITITALAIMAMGACAGMRISQEPRVAKLPPTGMLVTDDSTVGTKSVPVGAIAALVSDSGFARVSGHVDSARASKVADSAKKAAVADSAKTVSATALSPYMRRTGDALARGASLLFSEQTDNPSIQINGAQGYSASLSIRPYGGHAFQIQSYDSTFSLVDNSAGQILLDASVASGMSVYGKSNLWDRIAITNSGHAIWDTIKVLSSDSSINLPKLSLKTALAPAYGGTGLSAPGTTAGNLRWSGSVYAVDTAHYATTTGSIAYADSSRASKIADSAKKAPLISLTGAVAGSGTTSIATTFANAHLAGINQDLTTTSLPTFSQITLGYGSASALSLMLGDANYGLYEAGAATHIKGTAGNGIVADNDLYVTGKLGATGAYKGSYETLTAAGDASLTVDNTFVSSSSAVTISLNNGGTAGMRKTIANFGAGTVTVSYLAGVNSASLTLTSYAMATWVSNGKYWAKQ